MVVVLQIDLKTSIAKPQITELIVVSASFCDQDLISLSVLLILVDPARGYCYRCSPKPCESYVLREHGVLLSNTWITCPWVRHNPGKLGIIPDNAHMLECFMRKMDSSAQGWVCGLSGSRGFHRPPSRRRVRALGEVARRWILRHESRSYGTQQARNLHNVGNHDGGTPSAYTKCRLFSSLKSSRSKGRVRRVPAAAVIPAARVVLIIIEPKASVAGQANLRVNRAAQPSEFRRHCLA